jgi:hypothetical protein
MHRAEWVCLDPAAVCEEVPQVESEVLSADPLVDALALVACPVGS